MNNLQKRGTFCKRENEFVVTPPKWDERLIGGKSLQKPKRGLNTSSGSRFLLTLADDYPEMTEENVNSALQLAEEIVANAPYTIALQDRSWKISAPQIRSWLKFVAEPSDLATEQNRDLQAQPTSSIQTTIGFNEKLVLAFLEPIAKDVNRPAKNGKYERQEDGAFTKFKRARKDKC